MDVSTDARERPPRRAGVSDESATFRREAATDGARFRARSARARARAPARTWNARRTTHLRTSSAVAGKLPDVSTRNSESLFSALSVTNVTALAVHGRTAQRSSISSPKYRFTLSTWPELSATTPFATTYMRSAASPALQITSRLTNAHCEISAATVMRKRRRSRPSSHAKNGTRCSQPACWWCETRCCSSGESVPSSSW